MMAEPIARAMGTAQLEAWLDAHGIEYADLEAWSLRCPWCRWHPRAGLLVDATALLTRHALSAHPWQLEVFEIVVSGLRSEPVPVARPRRGTVAA